MDQLHSLKGQQGEKGEKGDVGRPFLYSDFSTDQLESLRGPPGLKGDVGPRGNPFTYQDFTQDQLLSLKGDKGAPFTFNDFTQQQLQSLKGQQGERGPTGPSASLSDLENQTFYCDPSLDYCVMKKQGFTNNLSIGISPGSQNPNYGFQVGVPSYFNKNVVYDNTTGVNVKDWNIQQDPVTGKLCFRKLNATKRFCLDSTTFGITT